MVAPADCRIDIARLTVGLGTLPREPEKQDALLYATYRKHDSESLQLWTPMERISCTVN